MLKIGGLAKIVGTTPRALRHYEDVGLIKPVGITSTGYRQYSENQIQVVSRIRELQKVGLSLDEIKEVIGLYFQENRKIEAKKKTLEYLEDHCAEIEHKIKLLQKMRQEIVNQINEYGQRLKRLSLEKGKKTIK